MKRYYLNAEGRVQGVGFRYFVYEHAIKMKLTGYVKNLDDGSVDMEIQGEGDFIDNFEALLMKGNKYVKVKKLNIKELDAIGNENNFNILY
jgi:acylphosphatase